MQADGRRLRENMPQNGRVFHTAGTCALALLFQRAMLIVSQARVEYNHYRPGENACVLL